MRILDKVQLSGWTLETVDRATAALSDMVAKNVHETDPDGHALAAELVRWMRCAMKTEQSAQSLVCELEVLRPQGDDAPVWQKFEQLLNEEQSLDQLIELLMKRFANAVPMLCMLLDEKVAPRDDWESIGRPCQRATQVLLSMGTGESLDYLCRNPGLLCWTTPPAIQDSLLAPHRAEFSRATLRAWPLLSWDDRVTLVYFCSDFGLLNDDIFECLLVMYDAVLDRTQRWTLMECFKHVRDPRAQLISDKLCWHGELSQADTVH